MRRRWAHKGGCKDCGELNALHSPREGTIAGSRQRRGPQPPSRLPHCKIFGSGKSFVPCVRVHRMINWLPMCW